MLLVLVLVLLVLLVLLASGLPEVQPLRLRGAGGGRGAVQSDKVTSDDAEGKPPLGRIGTAAAADSGADSDFPGVESRRLPLLHGSRSLPCSHYTPTDVSRTHSYFTHSSTIRTHDGAVSFQQPPAAVTQMYLWNDPPL